VDRRAEEYERRFPGTGIGEAQAIERLERIERTERIQSGHPHRRLFLVPEMPWKRERP